MAFIDHMVVHAKAGNGGPGVVRWLHLKGKDKGGPAGGNGGRGGDIIIEGVRDLSVLASYRYTKKFKGLDGDAGDNNNRTGSDGAPCVIKVPVGSVVKNTTTREAIEILREGERISIFKGGIGGLGNAHFKGAENQNPYEYTPGKNGTSGDIEITVKLIADGGFIGYPNAGKSSLLNELTHARSKVGAYPFTTLDPHLGDFYGFVLADIPGLIEGASSGRGLGSKFLRHIERTRFLVHLVSAEQEDPIAAYTSIRNELSTFGNGLAEKEEIVVLSKIDMLPEHEQQAALDTLSQAIGKEVLGLSILAEARLKEFSDTLTKKLREDAAG